MSQNTVDHTNPVDHRAVVESVRSARSHELELPIVGAIPVPRPEQIAYFAVMGLMVAFDIKEERGPELTERALAKGVILNATGPTTVRLIPPLIITKSDVDEAVAAIADILNTW